MAQGGEAFLPKTASPRALLAAVQLALARVRGHQSARRLDQPWNRLLPAPRG